jgi:predicted HTH domain antitoxin
MEQETIPETQQAMAVDLCAAGEISLAKAAHLAGLTRYEFAILLKRQDLPAYEHTEATYQEDLAFVASAKT